MKEINNNHLAQISDLDLRLIRIFKTIVECGGFTAAVPTLGIGRSAISLHMANLEARFGLKLCQRGRAGFVLTEEGREIYEASLRLLASVETFRSEVNSTHKELHGSLNIGITDNLVTLPHMEITNALAALKSHGPRIQINIHMRPPSEVERGVIDGHFQVGVIPEINKMNSLEYTSLYDEPAYLYCSEKHPLYDRDDATITAAELSTHDAIKPMFALSRLGQKQHQNLNETATANDREGTAFLIITGLYIGYLPEHFAQRWTQTGQLRTIRPADFNYRIKYATITRHGRLHHRILETFLHELKNSMQ